MEDNTSNINWEGVMQPYIAKYKDMQDNEVQDLSLTIPQQLSTLTFEGVIMKQNNITYVSGIAQYVGTEYNISYKTKL